MDVVQLLREDGSGLGVVDRRVAPAPGGFTPVGVMVHHTAGSRMHVEGLQRGYGFPGPLCNVGIDLDGTRYVVTDGRANDSGMGSSVVLDEVRRDIPVVHDARDRALADDVSGNPYFYDIEVVNDGRGQPYPSVQLDSLAVTCAALCHAHGWSAQRCIHHRQWTRRKIDMSWRGDLTGLIARNLQEDDMVTDADIAKIAGKVWDFPLLKGSTAGRRLAEIDNRTAKLLSRESVERVAEETGCDPDELAVALSRELARRLAE